MRIFSILAQCFGWNRRFQPNSGATALFPKDILPQRFSEGATAKGELQEEGQEPGKKPTADANADVDDSPSDTDEESSESEDEADDEEERWLHFATIPDSAFSLLVEQQMIKQGKPSTPTYHVKSRLHGSYNYAVILSNGVSKLVVKIPSIGIPSLWDPSHALIMRSEAHTLLYIKHHLPHFPCPVPLARDETFANPISAPYQIQSFLEGQSAIYTWFDGAPDSTLDVFAANAPTPELERLRATFLTSLARTMAELRHLSFTRIGMLYLDDETSPSTPTIAPHTSFQDLSPLERKYHTRPVFTTSAALYAWRTAQCHGAQKGRNFLRETLLSSPPFSASVKLDSDAEESLSLSLADLDLQNILVDPATGEVSGILDWEHVCVAPRCVGFSALPVWLQEDWFTDYAVPDVCEMFPWELEKYRGVYAGAMEDACRDDPGAARYCGRSAVYRAVDRVLFDDWGSWRMREKVLMEKLMGEIEVLRRVSFEEFQGALCGEEGEGDWEAAKEVWRERIPRALEGREC